MWINKNDIKELSDNIRKIIDGQDIDLRDNREGVWCILKNDIHTLANIKNEQFDVLQYERDTMKKTLADISHQIKTPLTSMMIMADLSENAPSDKQAEFLSNIRMGLMRLEWLASSLLKMAKLDAGAIIFTKEAVSSASIIGLALEPLQILLDVKNQTVDVIGNIDITCDKRWTAEALTNVIKNASEYSPENGLIKIESYVDPICRRITVTDNGSGIPKSEIPNLFKRFEGSRSTIGYGIGLPLALAILRSQNGDIEVETTGTSGTIFTLKFY